MYRLSSHTRVTFLAAALLSLWTPGCDKAGDADKPKAAAGDAAAGAKAVATEPVVVTAQALVQQFVSDPAAARAKYPRLTPFKVTGVVAGFGIDTLKLKSEDKPDQLAVACTFAESDQATIKKAKRGDPYTVIGKLNTYDAADKVVELISCKVAE